MRTYNIICLVVCIIGTLLPLEVSGAEWSYRGSKGPKKWKKSFPKCGGSVQSPIDIDSCDVVDNSQLGSINFINYNVNPISMKLKNDGHTLKVDVNSTMAINGGGLGATYNLAQFHFHWGSSNKKGSEHTVDRDAYAAEIHFVHYLSTQPDLGTAAGLEPNGLAVLGVFIEVGDDDNAAYGNIIDSFSDVKYKGDDTSIPTFPLESLFPVDKSFYRYQGSLTTPPCFESVRWTVFKNPVKISQSQMNEFRKVMEKEQGEKGNKKIVNNFRPTQPLNGRTVYYSEDY